MNQPKHTQFTTPVKVARKYGKIRYYVVSSGHSYTYRTKSNGDRCISYSMGFTKKYYTKKDAYDKADFYLTKSDLYITRAELHTFTPQTRRSEHKSFIVNVYAATAGDRRTKLDEFEYINEGYDYPIKDEEHPYLFTVISSHKCDYCNGDGKNRKVVDTQTIVIEKTAKITRTKIKCKYKKTDEDCYCCKGKGGTGKQYT